MSAADEERAELEPLTRQLVRTAGEYAISLVCLWLYFALQDETSRLRLELAELADRARTLRGHVDRARARARAARMNVDLQTIRNLPETPDKGVTTP